MLLCCVICTISSESGGKSPLAPMGVLTPRVASPLQRFITPVWKFTLIPPLKPYIIDPPPGVGDIWALFAILCNAMSEMSSGCVNLHSTIISAEIRP